MKLGYVVGSADAVPQSQLAFITVANRTPSAAKIFASPRDYSLL
jgi:hypothetical protein